MAIVSISRIQHRRGLQQDLPQLASAELGWSIDEQRLFIGNGTLAEGAPRLGNTEILTEHSDILRLAETYTFRNEDAGYSPATGGKASRFNSIAYGTASVYDPLSETYSPVDTYVVVGNNGLMLISTDASTWTPVYAGTSSTLNHICYGNNKFVAVGANGTIIYSTDGSVWNLSSTTIFLTLTSVVWAGGSINSFLATSTSGSILTSTDGITWSTIAGVSAAGLNGIDYYDGMVIAVGNDGAIRVSTDGATWNAPDSILLGGSVPPLGTEINIHLLTPTYYNLRTVKWDHDQWIIGGEYSTVLVSVDGINWTYGYTDTFRAAANNGANWTFVGDGGTIYRTITTDLSPVTSPTTENLYDLVYDSDDSIHVAVGANGTVITGNNTGSSWTVRTSGTSEHLNKVFYDSATGNFYAVGTTGTILYSADATTWSAKTSGVTANLYGISRIPGGNYIAVGANGTVLTSANGNTWTSHTSGTSEDLESVTVADLGGGTYRVVAVGTNGAVITSSNGITWSVQTSNVSNDLHGVNYITWTYNAVTSSKFFATGNNATVITSDDGYTWSTVDLATTATQHLFNAYYGNNSFWVVGSVGFSTIYGGDLTNQFTLIAQSLTVASNTASGYSGPAFYGSTYGLGYYVLVGQYDSTLTSVDGQNFVSQTQRSFSVESLANADLFDIYFDDSSNQFIAVGNKGLILTSTDASYWTGISYIFGNSETIRTIQRKLDDFVSVKDFGAKGDGLTDDTEAINRAMYELYCRTSSPAARKVLYFPGGRYIISDGLKVPNNAVLKGEGANNTIIQQTADPTYISYVMITADSKQQIESQIGLNGASLPADISIQDMALESAADGIWLVNASRVQLQRMRFTGGTNLPTSAGYVYIGIYMIGSSMNPPTDINVSDCLIEKYNYGVFQGDGEYSRNVIFNSTTFENLYQGIRLTLNDGLVNTMTVSNCVFDLIYSEAIKTNYAINLTSTFNSYRDVANGSGVATDPVVDFGDNSVGCTSINDQFDRTEAETIQNPWVAGNSNTGAWFGGHDFRVGLFAQQGGTPATLSPNQTGASTGLTFRISDDTFNQRIQYLIVRGNYTRAGILLVTYNADSGAYNIDDDSSETGDVGVTFSLYSDGSTLDLRYTSTAGGSNFTFSYAERFVKTVW